MNPATFLRVLGPEKWSVCYVEPSVRPDDSRYGENPNRLQQHTQFQVCCNGHALFPKYLAHVPTLVTQATASGQVITNCRTPSARADATS